MVTICIFTDTDTDAAFHVLFSASSLLPSDQRAPVARSEQPRIGADSQRLCDADHEGFAGLEASESRI